MGYCLVIHWNGPPPAWRYLLGAILITLSAQVIMGIGNSLLTKITSPSLQGLWMGFVVSFQWLVALLSGVWIPDPDTLSDAALPYVLCRSIVLLTVILDTKLHLALLAYRYC